MNFQEERKVDFKIEGEDWNKKFSTLYEARPLIDELKLNGGVTTEVAWCIIKDIRDSELDRTFSFSFPIIAALKQFYDIRILECEEDIYAPKSDPFTEEQISQAETWRNSLNEVDRAHLEALLWSNPRCIAAEG